MKNGNDMKNLVRGTKIWLTDLGVANLSLKHTMLHHGKFIRYVADNEFPYEVMLEGDDSLVYLFEDEFTTDDPEDYSENLEEDYKKWTV